MAKEKNYNKENAWDLVGDLMSTAMVCQAKSMIATKEQKIEIFRQALTPFVNAHNIALLLSEQNIEYFKKVIVEKALPNLKSKYVLVVQNVDPADVHIAIYERDAEGEPMPTNVIRLSQITQPQIITLINKFFTNNGTQPSTGSQQ